MAHRHYYLMALAAILLTANIFAVSPAEAQKLLSPAPANQAMTAEASARLQQVRSEAAVKSALVAQSDVSGLTPSTTQIELDLGRDLTAIVGNLRFEQDAAGITVWSGKVQDVRNAAGTTVSPADIGDGEVILAVNGTMITGTVRYGRELYRIVPLGEGAHAILELDESLIPQEADPIKDTSSEPIPDAVQPELANVRIRILLVMSNNAQARIADPQGLAAAMFAEANKGLENTGLDIRFESAGIFSINYDEPADGGASGFSKSLSDLQRHAEANALRAQRFADTVVMLVANRAYAGFGYVSANKNSAFAVVSASYATGNYTFAHEVGHNIGTNHETGGNIAHAHGYQQQSVAPYWRTIMAYECKSVGCPRVNYFSGPDNRYNGLPMGVAGISDNARVIREKGPLVAGFMGDPPTPEKPSNLQAYIEHTGETHLQWDPVPNAVKYHIYRRLAFKVYVDSTASPNYHYNWSHYAIYSVTAENVLGLVSEASAEAYAYPHTR